MKNVALGIVVLGLLASPVAANANNPTDSKETFAAEQDPEVSFGWTATSNADMASVNADDSDRYPIFI